ncbi:MULTISPECIES: ABC transporter permease [Cupriavidus]|uniref:ABC transporter permease n=1 Tax=Cupriavidus TaxID=106589 RepID=UPI0015FFB79F|nr:MULTISPECIES: ABC transporter permease [Cupriavidus]MBB1635746.1 sugar ABC transporter permease [Cupriavidus sp. UME77]MCP3023020.1 ABC transporter permease [Cupriavidus basilensis]MDR3380784.1 ABC transporter permease [Cupriavidus basilensis]
MKEKPSLHPLIVVQSVLANRSIITQFVKREVAGRYKGSFLGLLWTFINPLLMLLIYTFVFGVVFKSRWRPASTDHLEFAVVMFAGVLVHGLIAECLQRAPTLVVSNPNFVKKVVFPLETLPWIAIGSALFHTLVASVILIGAIFIWQGHLPLTVVLVPVILLPFVILIAGLVWLLASLGVYLRDLGQVMGIVTSLLMFMAPVFYPLQSVPERLRPLLYLNPITFIVEQIRNAAIWGTGIDWLGWLIYLAVGYCVAWAGLAWFQKTRKGFSDVL